MPTPLGHLVVPLVGRFLAGPGRVPPALLVAGIVAAVLPDADIVGSFSGLADDSPFAHRGFTHSLTFAALLAAAWAATRRRGGRGFAFAFLFVCAASHGALDACTNGGSGIAFLSPWSETRFFAPVRPIEVASIHPEKMLSSRGVAVLLSELLWLWLPALALIAIVGRRRRAPGNTPRAARRARR